MLNYLFNKETLYNWSDLFIAGSALVVSMLIFIWLVLKLWPLVNALLKKTLKSSECAPKTDALTKAEGHLSIIDGVLSGLDQLTRDQAMEKLHHIETISREVVKCAQASALMAEEYGRWTEVLDGLLTAIDSNDVDALRAAAGAVVFSQTISTAVNTRISFRNTPYWQEVRGMISSELMALNIWGKSFQEQSGNLILEISQRNKDTLMLQAVIAHSKANEKLRLVAGHLSEAETILRVTPTIKRRVLSAINDSYQFGVPALLDKS